MSCGVGLIYFCIVPIQTVHFCCQRALMAVAGILCGKLHSQLEEWSSLLPSFQSLLGRGQ